MANETPDAEKHDKARELTEQALDKLVQGQDSEVDALIAKAKKLDESAVVEVVDDLEEDAADRGEATQKKD